MFAKFLRQPLIAGITMFAILFGAEGHALESLGFTDLNKRVEQLETKDAFELSRQELADRIEELRLDVEEFIADNPDNPDVLVLSVRLSYLKQQFLSTQKAGGLDIMVDPQKKFAGMHERLDRAIELFPDYAGAYYWKGALYGMPVAVEDSAGQVVQRPTDLDKAIEYATRAVELDSRNGWYRRTLAMYHFTNGDNQAALDVLDTPEMANNPVRMLIRDLDAFPLPFGTRLLQQDTDSYIEMLMKQKSIKDYPNLRARVYLVPLSVEEMTEFFRTEWPNFEFFSRERSDLFAQYMLPHGEGVRPSAHLGEARTWASQNMGGMVLSVQEIRDASEEQRQASPAGERLPDNIDKDFSYLFMVNKRTVR